ncbi:MAG TPA: YtxH domain-containing protein [Bryobacteraceae bacterium]|nr:YtxH domain-containing protein [Bryobacteraceae bacterium]
MKKNAFPYFLLGAGIGGGIALLFAPEPGRKIRARIRHTALASADYLKDSTADIRSQAGDLFCQAMHVARKSSEAIETQRCGIMAAVEAGRRAYQKVVNA